jgi:hypothetical protein
VRVAYISGPIAGHEGLNEVTFRAAERRLKSFRARKFSYGLVIVPHDVPAWRHEGECPASYVKNGDHTAACYLRNDLRVMLEQATDVWMLPGWEASVGARLEMQVAAACGMGIKFFHRQDLGCAHTGHAEYRKCEEPGCWNTRKPSGLSLQELAAIKRPGEPEVVDTKGNVL